ncbi:MAG TPA: hypothetical protein VKY38_09725 [Azoarcus sp.]|nr:hypothetical protein [Azoarcus sp.]
MTEPLNEAEIRFLERIERRADFFRSLYDAGLALYLPADPELRSRTLDHFLRATARPKDQGAIRPETFEQAAAQILSIFEEMQKLLPTDVQYRNRLRRTW